MKFTFVAAVIAQVASAASLIDVLKDASATTLLALVSSDKDVATALSTFNGTLFAPTNAALTATVAAGFDPHNIPALTKVLEYHVVPAIFPPPNFQGPAFLPTLQGNELEALGSASAGIKIQSAFGTPAANVVKSLKYDGGIVHVIDQTLIPPANVVDVAKAAKLNSLLAALGKANLASTVAGLSNVTILAPTDDAFAAIASVASTLTVDQLTQVLLLHVVPGIVHSTDIIAAKTIKGVATKDGSETLTASFDGTNVLLAGAANKTPAKVIAADVLADNVLVHVIDTVLLPNFATTTQTSGALSSSSATSFVSTASSTTAVGSTSTMSKSSSTAASTSSIPASGSPSASSIASSSTTSTVGPSSTGSTSNSAVVAVSSTVTGAVSVSASGGVSSSAVGTVSSAIASGASASSVVVSPSSVYGSSSSPVTPASQTSALYSVAPISASNKPTSPAPRPITSNLYSGAAMVSGAALGGIAAVILL